MQQLLARIGVFNDYLLRMMRTWRSRRAPAMRRHLRFINLSTGIERERRLWPRRAASGRLWVRWQEGEEMVAERAELINISRGGALATLCQEISVGSGLLVSSEAMPLSMIRAQVVGVEMGDAGYRVRFRFDRPCPVSMFEQAGCKPDRTEPVQHACVPPRKRAVGSLVRQPRHRSARVS